MAIQYTIHADVVDIAQAKPKGTDCFLVDSNVWLWMTYSKAGHREPAWRGNVMSQYAGFVQTASAAAAKLYWCGLSLAELAHIIEKTEREIYAMSVEGIQPKEYRHNLTGERSRVVLEIQAAWGQVVSLAEPLTVSIDFPTTEAALGRLQTEKVDGYDLFILESMKNHGVVQVITDDGDFATVPGLQVFTSNRRVLELAQLQGKLLKR
jgi:predicted nucleic acid-binding protein